MSKDLGKLSNKDLLEKFGELYAGSVPAGRSVHNEYFPPQELADVYTELMLRLDYYDVTKKVELEESQHLGAKVNGLIKEVHNLKDIVKAHDMRIAELESESDHRAELANDDTP